MTERAKIFNRRAVLKMVSTVGSGGGAFVEDSSRKEVVEGVALFVEATVDGGRGAVVVVEET